MSSSVLSIAIALFVPIVLSFSGWAKLFLHQSLYAPCCYISFYFYYYGSSDFNIFSRSNCCHQFCYMVFLRWSFSCSVSICFVTMFEKLLKSFAGSIFWRKFLILFYFASALHKNSKHPSQQIIDFLQYLSCEWMKVVWGVSLGLV